MKKSSLSVLLLATFSVVATFSISSCASSSTATPSADLNRDGLLSDVEMEQFRRKQEVLGNSTQAAPSTNGSQQTMKGIRTAREAAATANTFHRLFSWF